MDRESTLSLPTSLVLAGLWATARAGTDDVCYLGLASATITECVPFTDHPKPTPCAGDGPKPWIKNPGPDAGIVTVAVPMPSCVSCGCPTCVWAASYTTTFSAFCPTGLTNKPYVVQELYTGLPLKPSVTSRPEPPHGFTTEVQTCTSCGAKPITATITFPDTKYPWATELSRPKFGPSGAPAWVVKPEGSDKGWVPAPVPPAAAKGGEAGDRSPAWIPFSGNNPPVSPVPAENKNGSVPAAAGNPPSGGGTASPGKTTGPEGKPVATAGASIPHFVTGLAMACSLIYTVVLFLL